MKKLFTLALFTLFMTSCGPKFYTKTALVDLRPYTERGFFITQSNSVSFEYESIGIIDATAYSGEYKASRNDPYKSNYNYKTFSSHREATVSDALYALYVRCINEGADGVINLQHHYTVDKKTGAITDAYVSGMAIRRVK